VKIARVVEVEPDAPGTATYWLELTDPAARAAYRFEAGQINMLYLWGLGAVPISVSSDPDRPERLAHTVRVSGSVTAAFPRLAVGDEVGLHGPFGRPWPVAAARGGDLVVVAGGLGLAPLRSAVYVALRERAAFGHVALLVGARTPADLVYRAELEAWRRRAGVQVELTVDHPDGGWPFRTGLVTTLLDVATFNPATSTALVCGPELMMVAVADELLTRGVSADRIFLSLERNMQCGIRRCGHCQLGPKFVCVDGPVFAYGDVAGWLRVGGL
jgi:NAD(P)H-flavin reductase